MSKLALMALGAALAFAQTNPTTPTTGPRTTGTSTSGATAPVPQTPPVATTPTTGPNTTGSSTTGATAPGQVTQGSSPITGDRTIPGTPSGTAMRNDVIEPARPIGTAERSSLPDTAGNWLALVLGGLSLGGVGLRVRFKTPSSRAARR